MGTYNKLYYNNHRPIKISLSFYNNNQYNRIHQK